MTRRRFFLSTVTGLFSPAATGLNRGWQDRIKTGRAVVKDPSRAFPTGPAPAPTGCMDSLLVVGWAALATLVNLGVDRWCRARDRRTAEVAR
jgi:hypothetical protein